MTLEHGTGFKIPKLVSHPKVVLGVPAHNEARFIESTLESIRSQSHEDFAVLISDNASTDATEGICRGFVERDPRFAYHRHHENIGAARNFDFVRNATASPFFAWVGGHDLLHPDYLAAHLRELERHPDIGVSFSCFDFIDRLDRTLEKGNYVGDAAPRSSNIFRYLWSVALGPAWESIHGLYRRELMSPTAIHACPVSDLVFVSNSQYFAPSHLISGHFYRLRLFEDPERPRKQMERLDGKSDASTLDFRRTIACFLEDFDRIIPPDSWQRRMKPLVRWTLRDRFLRPPLLLRPFRMTKMLRSLVKRIHGVRGLFVDEPERPSMNPESP